MSKEKEAEDGACIFHRWRQAWKSRKVSHFLGKLDNLLKKNSKISIPAQELFYGDPLDVSAPTTAKSGWQMFQDYQMTKRTLILVHKVGKAVEWESPFWFWSWLNVSIVTVKTLDSFGLMFYLLLLCALPRFMHGSKNNALPRACLYACQFWPLDLTTAI